MTLRKLLGRTARTLFPPPPNPLDAIYDQFHEFTMVSREVFRANLALAQRISCVEGCVIECGVWRGGMIAGIARVLGPNRKYYLFDSFEGLPPAQEIDGKGAADWQRDKDSATYYDNCRAAKETSIEAMTLAGARDFELVPGWFHETVPAHRDGEPIALLRLDADWYDSTKICLENLFDRVAIGGIIIIDDYHTWDGCSRAVHDFLSRRSASERIDCHNNVCFIQKRQAELPRPGIQS